MLIESETWFQAGKRILSKIAIVTIMVMFWASLLVWPMYNWLAS